MRSGWRPRSARPTSADGRPSAGRSGFDWTKARRLLFFREAGPDMPVLHVNAYDAQAYIQWLVLETGKDYRLPSEAEYEYVARVGGKGSYWWGEGSPAEVVENLTGERDKSPANRKWTTSFKRYGDGHWGPAPAGSPRQRSLGGRVHKEQRGQPRKRRRRRWRRRHSH